jgi:hypothetical protein
MTLEQKSTSIFATLRFYPKFTCPNFSAFFLTFGGELTNLLFIR